MKLIPRSLLRWQIQSSDGPVLCALSATTLLVLEVYGRFASTEIADALALGVLICVGLFVKQRYRTTLSPLILLFKQRVRRVGQFLRRFHIDVGVDLRGEPRLAPAVPAIFRALIIVIAVLAAILLWTQGSAMVAVLVALRRYVYTAYLLGLATVWMILLAALLFALLVPLMFIHDEFVLRHTKAHRRSKKWELGCMLAYLLCMLAAAFIFPLWIPALLIGLLSLLDALVLGLPGNPELKLLWRGKQQDSPLWSFSWRRFTILEILVATGFSLELILAACGPRIVLANPTSGSQALPATAILGTVLGWAYLGALGALSYRIWRLIYLARRRNPARACLPRLYIWNDLHRDARQRAISICRQKGWQARFEPRPPARTDVQIALTSLAEASEPPAERDWPINVAVHELENADLWERINRRDEIQKRRQLLRGLEMLFKRAARRRFRNGTGYIIGLQHWFIAGLVRDEDEEDFDHEDQTLVGEFVGPAYHKLFPNSVRHHFHQIMSALDLDLLFVQDGVGFRRLRNVLRVMLELYDVHGARQPAEERYFTGIAGVRVIIHDYETTEPLIRLDYPEPEYEQISRARIMEVFRDRGEPDEQPEEPVDADWILQGV